jgi:hypothetical protein
LTLTQGNNLSLETGYLST